MKTKFFVCIALCAIIFCSCTTPTNDTEETPTVTPKATPVSTLAPTPTPTPDPTPTPTPPLTKPEVSDGDRKTMLSDMKTYIETVKLKGDIVTVSYSEDVPLSGRYYAKYSRREPNPQRFKMPFLPISALLMQGNTSCMPLHKCLDMNKNCYFKLLRTRRS